MIAVFVVAVIVAAVVAMGAGGSSGGDYKVRAVFNNASFLIPGEDVKIAGAKVGKVDSLDVTLDLRAAAVLSMVLWISVVTAGRWIGYWEPKGEPVNAAKVVVNQ